uniref:Uncharacterized protein n=1 Tax=Plectus sambesii TaxID=2011161 RepID=A0A914UWJ9_9BILA
MRASLRLQFLLRSIAALLILVILYSLIWSWPIDFGIRWRRPIERDIAWSGRELNESTFSDECVCRRENSDVDYNFCFSVKVNGSIRFGQKFDCKWLPLLDELKILEPNAVKKEKFESPVFATGSSSNHFLEARALIVSIRAHFGNTPRILFHDLGLDDDEAAEIKAACNVEYRKFSFDAYPPSVGDLTTFRWKTLLISQLQREFSTFWWVDSSIRWSMSSLNDVYDAVSDGRVGSYLGVDKAYHSVFAATNPAMYKYLPIDIDKAKATMMYGGGFILFHRTPASVEVLKWLVLCAMEDNCINPPYSYLHCQFVDGEHWKLYAYCHRYDQSAVNIILANLNDYNESFYTTKSFQDFATVKRTDRSSVKLARCVKE